MPLHTQATTLTIQETATAAEGQTGSAASRINSSDEVDDSCLERGYLTNLTNWQNVY